MTLPKVNKVERKCPKCGAEVEWHPDCPGWEENGKIMAHSECDNADRWECKNEECDWWYRYPNKRSDKDMGVKPDWDARFLIYEDE